MKKVCLSALLVCSLAMVSLPGCGGSGKEPVVLLNLLSQQGAPPPISEVRVILNGGESETLFDLGGQFVVPLVSAGERFQLGLRFPKEFEGQEVSLEVIGLQNGVDVLSGEISLVVEDSDRLNNVFIGFCGNEITDAFRGEECEDANNIEGDGCDSNCTVSACGNGVFAPGELCFAPPVEFPVGDNPVSVATGDFNDDSEIDLAVANFDSDSVGVLLGNGNGAFESQLELLVGDGPISLAVADLDQDNLQDIVTANTSSDDVSVLLNDGENSFQDTSGLLAGGQPSAVVAGDFNSDGIPDLATVNRLSADVSAFLGSGDGTFQEQIISDINNTSFPVSAAVGDFDRDARLDIVTANPQFNQVIVLFGIDNGSFLSQVEFTVIRPDATVVEDIDSNGIIDVVTANGASSDISVLLGNGNGFFQNPINFFVGDGPISIKANDFNKDGIKDVVTANRTSDDVSILLGNGDGTLQNQQIFVAGDRPNSVTAGDFNNDGFLDLATANSDSNSVSVLLFDP